jgi:hypothetical protein
VSTEAPECWPDGGPRTAHRERHEIKGEAITVMKARNPLPMAENHRRDVVEGYKGKVFFRNAPK